MTRLRKIGILGFSQFLSLPIFILITFMAGCTRDKVVIVQQVVGDFPSPVSLIYPLPDTFFTEDHPVFIWHQVIGSIRYQVQVSPTSDFVAKTIDAYTSDTSYSTVSSIANNSYYWRVRSRNAAGIWGNWPDAEIRLFNKSDNINYIELLSQTITYGQAQDVYVRSDTAYVADGQADLTIINVSNPFNPVILRNMDTHQDDFAKGVYISESDTFSHIFVADMDGKMQAFNAGDTATNAGGAFGSELNTEDVSGITVPDSLGIPQLWILVVSSSYGHRKLTAYLMSDDESGCIYADAKIIEMPADAMGLCVNSGYVYVACATSGLRIFDFRDPYNPIEISFAILTGTALSVDVQNGNACLATDRTGFYIVDVRDWYNPIVIKNVNTSGRAKDVQIAGNYAFIADGSGGLKVIDIAMPESAHVVAAYATPYAYGLWATNDYIYLCDRDLGLMIFQNKVSE